MSMAILVLATAVITAVTAVLLRRDLARAVARRARREQLRRVAARTAAAGVAMASVGAAAIQAARSLEQAMQRLQAALAPVASTASKGGAVRIPQPAYRDYVPRHRA